MAACLNPQFLLDVKQKSHLFTQQIMARVLQTSPRYPLFCQREPSASIAWFGLGQKTSWLGELLSLKTRLVEYLTSR